MSSTVRSARRGWGALSVPERQALPPRRKAAVFWMVPAAAGSPGAQAICQIRDLRGSLMRATVIYGAGDVRVEEVTDPVIREPTDAVARVLNALHLRQRPVALPVDAGLRRGGGWGVSSSAPSRTPAPKSTGLQGAGIWWWRRSSGRTGPATSAGRGCRPSAGTAACGAATGRWRPGRSGPGPPGAGHAGHAPGRGGCGLLPSLLTLVGCVLHRLPRAASPGCLLVPRSPWSATAPWGCPPCCRPSGSAPSAWRADPADRPPVTDHSECALNGLDQAHAFEHGAGAVAAGQLPDPLNALVRRRAYAVRGVYAQGHPHWRRGPGPGLYRRASARCA